MKCIICSRKHNDMLETKDGFVCDDGGWILLPGMDEPVTDCMLQYFRSDKYLLILTACINPQFKSEDIPFLNDEKERLSDYEKALKFWIDYPDFRIRKILFIENSGADLSSLQSIPTKSKSVEFVSLNENFLRPDRMHYGYSEMMMLDHGLEKSKLARTSSTIIKVTGRLVFPKLSRLLSKVPKEAEAVFETRRHFVTTQLFISSMKFYEKNIKGSHLRMKREIESSHIERLFRKEFEVLRKTNKNLIMRFPVNCDPVGRAAHWGKTYESSKEKLKSAIRAVTRVILPEVWI